MPVTPKIPSRHHPVRRILKPIAALGIVVVSAVIIISVLHVRNSPIQVDTSVAAIDSASTINDPAWFDKAYKDGFRLYILHSTAWGTCQPWSNTYQQAKMALDAGLKIAAYTRNPNCFKEGIEALGTLKDKLQFFALDIETDPGIPVTRAMVDGVRALGVRPVIYTGSGMWPTIMGSSNAFSDVPLWDTNTSKFAYNEWEIDYTHPAPLIYGGWNTASTMRVGVQQQFEYTLNGVAVDLNSFDKSFLQER